MSKQSWVKAFFRWVLAVLKKAAHLAPARNSEISAMEKDLEAQAINAQPEPILRSGVLTEPKIKTEEVLPSEVELTSPSLCTMEHAEHCPRASKTAEGTALNSNTDQVAETEFEEVWARLGLELRNAGISAAMLKTDKVTIADWIITTQREKHKRLDEEEEMEEMRKEAEEEKRKRRKARKAEKKAMKAERKAIEFLSEIEQTMSEAVISDDATAGGVPMTKGEDVNAVESIGGPSKVAKLCHPTRMLANTEHTGQPVKNSIAVEGVAERKSIEARTAGKPAAKSSSDRTEPQPKGKASNMDQVEHETTGRTIWMAAGKDDTWLLDQGGFTMKEILVGLGKDELGERRLWRLQRRFKKLLDVMLGLK